jgi:hypothetical protein
MLFGKYRLNIRPFYVKLGQKLIDFMEKLVIVK